MKPNILKITGINSFDETQEIDFLKILNNGIFGIFGDTGSGKSTILDAITLALYGKIVRYNGKSGNGDFINLNRDNAKVEFIFSIKSGNDEIFYEIIRHFKKDAKGDIKTNIIRLCIFNNEKKEIISDKKKEIDKKIVDIIGLNYDDFTKAVVLPQGKFSDFLMLENSDKRKMLQRIFNLEKYGDKLKNKIGEKKYIQKNILESLKKEIEIYGDISIENIEEEKNLLLKQTEELQNIKKDIKKISEEENYLNNILNIKKEHMYYNKKLEELIPYEQTILNFENHLKNILEAENIIPHILERNNLYNTNKEITNIIENLNNELEKVNNNYNDIQDKYNFYKNQKEIENPKLEKIKQDLEQCIIFINEKSILETDIYNVEKDLININDNIAIYKTDILKLENKKSLLKNELDEIIVFNKNNKIDVLYKEELKNAIKLKEEEKNFNLKIENIIKNIDEYNDKLNEYQINIKEIKNKILNTESTIKSIITSNIHNLENKVIENNKLIQEKYNKNKFIESKLNELEIQIKIQENKEILKELSINLTKNKPCPLCGSKEHPNPIKITLDDIFNILKENKYKNENKIKKNLDYINDLNLENTILYKIIEDIKDIAKKYNITNYEYFNSEHIVNKNEVLFTINKYENILNETNKQLDLIRLSNENILRFKQEKLDELQQNKILLKEIKQNLDNYNKNLNTNNFYEKYDYILQIEDKISKNNEKYLKVSKDLDIINIENDNIKGITTKLEKDEISLNIQKENSQKRISEINIKIEKLSYNKNPKEYIIDIEEKIKNILQNEIKYKKLFNDILEQKNYIEKNINQNLIKKEINNDNIIKKEIHIKEYIAKSNFNNEKEILNSYKEKEKRDFYEIKIDSYKEKFNDYHYNIKRIENEFNSIENNTQNINNLNINVLNNEIEQVSNKKHSYNEKNNILIESITTLKINIEQKEKIYKNTEQIKNKIKQEEKKLDLLKELSELNKGGIFVEYVANKYLKHIVLDASKRLLNISQSKYSLELLNNNFVIKDYYNGGVIRSPRSLSGGEVFMASLSLALALSNRIQLKNKSPLEIFFLDEGFGTLDNNNLDIVINTLEELQTSNINVGIITHIEEIKNRVQNKILVISNNNGSKIIV